MNKTAWERKNTVESKDQVSRYVKFEGTPQGSPKIMFLGNSITWHAPKEDIGWSGDWGMAASTKENDYVHRVMAKIKEKHPEAAFCIVQGALWERGYKDFSYEAYASAGDFNPDIIISFICDNASNDGFDHDLFIDSLGRLHKYLSGNNDAAKIVALGSFATNEVKDKAVKEYAEKVGAEYIYIGDLNKDKDNLAIGLFWHEGVAYHPGNKGMEILAGRILKAINI